jgi:two-component system sensor histidine kinase HydH
LFCLNLGLFHLARFFAGVPGLPLSIWVAQTISLLPPLHRRPLLLRASSPPPAPRPATSCRRRCSPSCWSRRPSRCVPGAASRPRVDRRRGVRPAYVIGGLFYATVRMWRAARAAEGTAAAPRLRYLFYASLVALALGQPGIPVVGPIVTAVYLYFMAQTLVRERLLDLPEILGRITT